MKAKVLALAVAIFSMSALSASAQCNKAKQGCGKAQACAQQATGEANKMYQPQTFTDFAFEGILLDVDQQAKIDEINAKYAPGQKPCKMEGKCDKQGDKKECKRACKEAAKQARQQNRCDYVDAVKEVLTPEQYTVFLENIAKMPQPMHKGRIEGKCDKVKGAAKAECRKAKAECKKECKKAQKAAKQAR